ncbi:methionyl-tRNA formyltransferase [Gillisia sp. Hel1_33_143]|uniref:methionyl-tRNA formyltransferase n=1 Tax=Gillisia sp. Hel1_33_143 TaxID=1336796 RepID=UPI00087C8153|nr:methionyl-tRNA formyltransferase [Gillisia sp. Hel1_33_143]SDS49844.1 methionyl-tRNA formyltransferase [Gillisia sp. Hel1_33_143]
MKDLRIIFMGTPEFAVSTLKEIIEHKFNVVGVITAPDRPAGRGRKLQESAVKEFAVANNLKILQPTNLKSEGFLEELKELNANVQVVVAFRMLPKAVWQMPALGTFNLHASLLPQYRGAAPINWAIINGETKTGVSTFFIDEKIDTGEMILQKEVEILPEDNLGDLHDKLMNTGAKLVTETLQLLKQDKISTTKQIDNNDLKEAPKLTKENTQIDWSRNAKDIKNHVRGLNPYPTAWTLIQNGNEELKVKVFEVEIEDMDHNEPLGRLVVENKTLKVSAKDAYIIFKEIQLPGKRKMEVKQLLNGFNFEEEAKVL